jgi:hypothetical protein
MSRILKYFLLLILLNLIFVSCTKAVDFNQINDLELNPVIESSLIFFDEPASRFLDNGNEVLLTQDFIIVDFFNNGFIEDNLVKAEFVFETENSIDRRFDLQIDFLDSSGQQQHSLSITQQPLSNNSYIEVFEEDTLDALKNTTLIVFRLRLSSGNPAINETTPGTIKLKSKTIFYFNIIDPL